jgi:hypothetical protein
MTVGSRYLTELADWCRAAGLVTVEVDGWQHRARSSGGFDGDRPWAVMWHHTASATSPENDVNYICYGSPDAPISNLLLDRDGVVWVCAAGATNTNGKGGPWSTTRGVVPQDSMNTHAVSIEAANDGVGEWWPQVQIDAYFTLSLTLAERLGLQPDDICEHQSWAPDRKIDPAVADAVQGPWQPHRANSSGTWLQDDVIDELWQRATSVPPTPPGPLPPPTPVEGDDVLVVALDSNGTAWVGNGIKRFALTDPAVFDRYVLVWAGRFFNTSGKQVKGWPDVATVDDLVIESLGQP